MTLTAFLPTGAPQVLPFIGTPGVATVGYALVWSESPQGFSLAPIGPDQFTQNLNLRGTGALTSIGTTAAGTQPYDVSYDPTGRFLAVANSGANTVQTYLVNQSTGALTSIGTAATGASPRNVSYDPTGRFLAVANFGAATVRTYSASNFALGNGTAVNLESRSLRILDTTASTSTTTGAVRIDGGLGVAGAIYNGGNLVSSGAKANFANLPTSDIGLAVGDLWRDGNTVKVKI